MMAADTANARLQAARARAHWFEPVFREKLM
jgi:hypothetical protein